MDISNAITDQDIAELTALLAVLSSGSLRKIQTPLRSQLPKELDPPLIAAWASLSEERKKILRLSFGLDGQDVRHQLEIAAVIGLNTATAVVASRKEAEYALADAYRNGPFAWEDFSVEPRSILRRRRIRQPEHFTAGRLVDLLEEERRWGPKSSQEVDAWLAKHNLPSLYSRLPQEYKDDPAKQAWALKKLGHSQPPSDPN